MESASINKSLFVLAQCVEAISKKQSRIPYRESKMTRILSLGQNKGITLMILNLAPVRAYHLDTISSLNFANRTKKIEVREIENDPMFKGPARSTSRPTGAGSAVRQPLRPLTASVNANLTAPDPSKAEEKKPLTKAFHVYSDKQPSKSQRTSLPRRSSLPKRRSDATNTVAREGKSVNHSETEKPTSKSQEEITDEKIQALVEKKVEEILAARAKEDSTRQQAQVKEISEKVQRRLEMLEKRIEGTEDARAEGLSYLLMAKQHHARGEETSALKMYRMALPFFPRNEKLAAKIAALEEKLQKQREPAAEESITASRYGRGSILSLKKRSKIARTESRDDVGDAADQEPMLEDDDEDDISTIAIGQKRKRANSNDTVTKKTDETEVDEQGPPHSPRTAYLLNVINSRDVSQIKLLKGVGVKKAEAIVDCLCEMDMQMEGAEQGEKHRVCSLAELGTLKGVGSKMVQNMRNGVVV